MKTYETVIGLEVHVELSTKTKLFCACPTKFGGEPNRYTCPVCTGMPGSLPVLNKKVVEYAIAVGLALNCEISPYSKFDRKNYFYPDNPQGYQISQLYLPICKNGSLTIETKEGTRKIGIHEIHMEEDAGKLIHRQEGYSLIDYNRSGVPLLEIVSEPDFRSAPEVIAYLEKLRHILRYLGVSDGKLQEGSLRADVNLSVREMGAKTLGVRTEMKNLNSFRAIKRAVESESKRQISLLEEGSKVLLETRRWDEEKGESYPMRSKEEAKDYRYFPEPDLPPIQISEEWIGFIQGQRPEFREEKIERYQREYEIPLYDIELLCEEKALAELFEETTRLCGQPKKAANWLLGEGLRLLKEKELEEMPFSPEHLAELILLVEEGTIHTTMAKEIFTLLFTEDISPKAYVKKQGLKIITDEESLKSTVLRICEENPKSVEDYRKGKTKALGFLTGQTMKALKGQADPKTTQKILLELLSQIE